MLKRFKTYSQPLLTYLFLQPDTTDHAFAAGMHFYRRPNRRGQYNNYMSRSVNGTHRRLQRGQLAAKSHHRPRANTMMFLFWQSRTKKNLPLINTSQKDQGLLSGRTQLLRSTELLLATVRYQTCPRYGDRGQWSNTLVGMWRTPLEKWNVRTRHFCYSII